jgi:hypothetical protein
VSRQQLTEWSKCGLVVAPFGDAQTLTHAMLPTPRVTKAGMSVLFASCDRELRGRVFSVDLPPSDSMKFIGDRPKLVFDLGSPGAFDADGVNPSQLVERDGFLFLYYIGWHRQSSDVPYTLFAGMAVSDDDGASFRRCSNDPILPPVQGEEYFRTAPYVYMAGGRWGMLYIGGGTFFNGPGGKRLPTYSLRQTYSDDGIVWDQPSRELLRPNTARGEIGFGRPVGWHDGSGWPELMLSIRTVQGYRLAGLSYGASAALRQRELLPTSKLGWDSEMVCFGAPCVAGESEFLFYNGNQFGRAGFGLASRPRVPGLRGNLEELLRNLDASDEPVTS